MLVMKHWEAKWPLQPNESTISVKQGPSAGPSLRFTVLKSKSPLLKCGPIRNILLRMCRPTCLLESLAVLKQTSSKLYCPHSLCLPNIRMQMV